MDFSFTEEQDALRELATRILSDLSTGERLKEVEGTDDRIDRKLWSELGSAGLLGVALPESCGGPASGSWPPPSWPKRWDGPPERFPSRPLSFSGRAHRRVRQ